MPREINNSHPDIWVSAFRLVARAFPNKFHAICGDGLERLGMDLIPRIYRDEGFGAVVLCFADILTRLPIEYASVYTKRFKEKLIMTNDPFEGTWRSNVESSQFDPNYSPEQACIRFEATDEGYLMVAYGVKDGQAVAERPTSIIPDGRRRPIVDLNGRPIAGVPAGAVMFGIQSDARTIEAGAEVDGKSLGKGTYKISEDGNVLTVINEGEGLNGPFKTVAVFERVVPDPYLPKS